MVKHVWNMCKGVLITPHRAPQYLVEKKKKSMVLRGSAFSKALECPRTILISKFVSRKVWVANCKTFTFWEIPFWQRKTGSRITNCENFLLAAWPKPDVRSVGLVGLQIWRKNDTISTGKGTPGSLAHTSRHPRWWAGVKFFLSHHNLHSCYRA